MFRNKLRDYWFLAKDAKSGWKLYYVRYKKYVYDYEDGGYPLYDLYIIERHKNRGTPKHGERMFVHLGTMKRSEILASLPSQWRMVSSAISGESFTQFAYPHYRPAKETDVVLYIQSGEYMRIVATSSPKQHWNNIIHNNPHKPVLVGLQIGDRKQVERVIRHFTKGLPGKYVTMTSNNRKGEWIIPPLGLRKYVSMWARKAAQSVTYYEDGDELLEFSELDQNQWPAIKPRVRRRKWKQ